MNFEEFEVQVFSWLRERKILDNSNAQAQFIKLTEELGELAAAIAREDLDGCEDAIGDMLVLLVSVSAQLGLTPLESCWNRAWNEIKNRKGYLNESGVFVKEEEKENG